MVGIVSPFSFFLWKDHDTSFLGRKSPNFSNDRKPAPIPQTQLQKHLCLLIINALIVSPGFKEGLTGLGILFL